MPVLATKFLTLAGGKKLAMATGLEYDDRVKYACSCSTFSPLVYQYFCKYCVKIRCPDCVTTSVDTFYCPHCFDTVPPLEAKARKGRCKNCYKCPRCMCVLSTRAHVAQTDATKSVAATEGKDQAAPKATETSPLTTRRAVGRSPSGSSIKGDIKKLYLLCNCCRWSSRQANIPDVKNVTEFQEAATAVHKKVSELVSSYKKVALQEKADRDKTLRKHKFHGYYGLLELKYEKANLVSSRSMPVQLADPGKDPLENVAAVASQDPEPLPPEIYTELVQLDKVMGVKELLKHPLQLPTDPSELRPLPVLIMGKRLRRCKGCDHILCKSEYNPSSVRFKVQQVALNAVPAIKLAELPKLILDQENVVKLSFTNPCASPIMLSFNPCLDIALLKSSGFQNFAKVCLPDGEYQLSGIDDALYDDAFQEQDTQLNSGNPEYIINKTVGKLTLKFQVTPTRTADETRIGFVFKFTPPVPEKADETRAPLAVVVIINLGQTTCNS